jgi:opacity protein-like surface antigen
MKTIIATLMALTTLTAAQASDYSIMAGMEVGQSKGEWNNYSRDSENNIGGRIGIETKESRIYASYNSIDTELEASSSSVKSQTLVLNLETKTRPTLKIFRAFVGGHIGAIYSEIDTPWYIKDEANLIYGAQIGILMDIVDNLGLEAGYKYSFTNANNDSPNPENIQTYYGAINLKF